MANSDGAISIYMREIGKAELLTPEEEILLAARIKKGDETAVQTMIKANLRLVVKIARDYAQYGLPLLDLISEGNIGLIKAVRRFDPQKGGKLSTYAAWWIKQAIKRALANQSKTIRLPAHLVDKIARMRRTEHKLTEKLGRDPTVQEVAEAMDIDPATIENWRVVALRPTSLHAPIGDDSSELAELIPDVEAPTPYDELNDQQLLAEVDTLLDRLDERERTILKYRYGLGDTRIETLEEVGARFNITRERVRQIQNAAVAKLREYMDENETITVENSSTKKGSQA
jgi:RNA polymerase primary sigma factor